MKWLVFSLLLLAGCTHNPPRPPERVETSAIPAQCAPQCFETCEPEVWPQWRGNPQSPATWDNIDTDVVIPLINLLEQCEIYRVACAQCLNRLERANVICGVSSECKGAP